MFFDSVVGLREHVLAPSSPKRLGGACSKIQSVQADSPSQRKKRMSLIVDLKESSPNLSISSKYTSLNGVIYLALGILLIIWPGAVQTLLLDRDFVGNEAALMRVVGMAVAVIGWLYFFGGRSGGRQVVAASVLDRIIFVPLVLIPMVLAGIFPHTLAAFAILDPTLGLIAWWLLSREKR